jgi:radical SAM superfamily enzyme YgiQ (UPF0313 family)
LRDEELVDLIAASGGKWIFIGMESLDAANLSDVNKNFSKPGEYAAVLNRLAKRDIYAITSFIFGLDNDTAGVAERTLRQIELWPPGLPVFSALTPLPGTPLYARLENEGRLTRPRHWLDFAPFKLSHSPLKITVAEVEEEIDKAWRMSYSPERNENVVNLLIPQNPPISAMHLLARLCFRGIYVPQMTRTAWLRLLIENRRPLLKLIHHGVARFGTRKRRRTQKGMTAVTN